MNDELGWKQRLKTWIISVLEDLWSALWRSLLAVPAVVLLFYLLEPDPTPGLGSGMAILGLMLLTVMFFSLSLFCTFVCKAVKNKTRAGGLGSAGLLLTLC